MLTAALLCFGCLGVRPATAQQKVSLKLDFSTAKKYQYDFSTHQDIRQTIKGQEVRSQQDIRMGYTMQAGKKDAAGNTVVESTYNRFSYLMNNPMMGGKVGYDSGHPEDSSTANGLVAGMMSRLFKEVFSGFLHHSFSFTISPQGKVISVTGITEMMDSALDHADFLPQQVREAMKTNMKKSFSNEAMRETLDKSFDLYAGHPVAVGDSWEKSASLTTPVAMDMQSHYTVKDIKDKTVSLAVSSTLASGQSGETKLSGTQSGTMEVDRKSGIPLRADLNQKMEGSLSTQGMTIPMEITGTITITGKAL
ncbi:hypothetical protein GCM10023143_00540 [Compostibacter hankyongensis]|uniref:Uncharacterized protein n=1 Tax=Compostibacter hankyongensis TaxID=1007089 RepID=A0ABP8FBS0_9BACT